MTTASNYITTEQIAEAASWINVDYPARTPKAALEHIGLYSSIPSDMAGKVGKAIAAKAFTERKKAENGQTATTPRQRSSSSNNGQQRPAGSVHAMLRSNIELTIPRAVMAYNVHTLQAVAAAITSTFDKLDAATTVAQVKAILKNVANVAYTLDSASVKLDGHGQLQVGMTVDSDPVAVLGLLADDMQALIPSWITEAEAQAMIAAAQAKKPITTSEAETRLAAMAEVIKQLEAALQERTTAAVAAQAELEKAAAARPASRSSADLKAHLIRVQTATATATQAAQTEAAQAEQLTKARKEYADLETAIQQAKAAAQADAPQADAAQADAPQADAAQADAAQADAPQADAAQADAAQADAPQEMTATA